jgi:hypothetical protein
MDALRSLVSGIAPGTCEKVLARSGTPVAREARINTAFHQPSTNAASVAEKGRGRRGVDLEFRHFAAKAIRDIRHGKKHPYLRSEEWLQFARELQQSQWSTVADYLSEPAKKFLENRKLKPTWEELFTKSIYRKLKCDFRRRVYEYADNLPELCPEISTAQ